MPASQRFLAPLLLVILALPVAIVAVGTGLGLQPGSFWVWAWLSPLFLVIPGLVLVIHGLSLGPKPGQPFDAPRFERQGRSSLLGAAFVVGAVALLVAAATSPTVALLIIGVTALWVLLWTPTWLRRVKVESSALIQRDAATVFSFVADAQNLPLYRPTVLSVEKLTEGPIGPGTEFRSEIRLTSGTTTKAITQIVDYEPDRRMTSRVISGLTPNLDVITFAPADGGTLLHDRSEWEISFNLALAGAAFRNPHARLQIMAAQQSFWIDLKHALETTESDPPKT